MMRMGGGICLHDVGASQAVEVGWSLRLLLRHVFSFSKSVTYISRNTGRVELRTQGKMTLAGWYASCRSGFSQPAVLFAHSKKPKSLMA